MTTKKQPKRFSWTKIQAKVYLSGGQIITVVCSKAEVEPGKSYSFKGIHKSGAFTIDTSQIIAAEIKFIFHPGFIFLYD